MGNNVFTILSDEDKQQLLDSGALFTGEGEAVRLEAPADKLLTIMKILRDRSCACSYLGDISAVDRGEKGFEVVYQLFSLAHNAKGTVKTSVGRDNPVVPSVTALWPGGDWLEREVYDLMGIIFEDHPDLTRILLDEDFIGHPLRKDFRMQPAD